MFPKPEPTGEDKHDPKWGQMYEAYRDWVEQEFGDDEDRADGTGILDESQLSSQGTSEVSKSV